MDRSVRNNIVHLKKKETAKSNFQTRIFKRVPQKRNQNDSIQTCPYNFYTNILLVGLDKSNITAFTGKKLSLYIIWEKFKFVYILFFMSIIVSSTVLQFESTKSFIYIKTKLTSFQSSNSLIRN